MSVISMVFKKRLKELRAEKMITQEELARALDIPESTIRRLESSDQSLPRHERLEKIADFFNVSVDYLLGRTNEKCSTDITDPFISAINDPTLSEEDKNIINLIRNLPPNKKHLVKELLEAFKSEIDN
ncbi:XRE family transcriptional regulator [Brevibacillus laterosporus]|uniref:XRE family transcriptional regulator n=1 Tax=Brevibacillus laterosporus TaxID=1465 RepID=A0A518V4V9_BRELA|nr:XRE family transcriptional regulator [Brevibacillus laterosporus]